MIEADDLADRLADLEPIGRDERGTTRLAWTPEDEAAGSWFARRAAEVGLRVEIDPAGNRWAVPDAPGPWWGVGSHLDSVRAGGCYDGALGVCAAFAIAERAPVAVVAFADEEGARFNTPTFGSRALSGKLDLAVLDRRDDNGVRLADAMRAAGVDPDGVARAPEWLDRLRGFVELHIDQTPDLDEWLAELPEGPELTVASRSDGVTFDADLRAALGDAEGVVCLAGHDAGILAERLPAAMVLTRNPSGVSHSPEETADLDDAAAAANAILGVMQ